MINISIDSNANQVLLKIPQTFKLKPEILESIADIVRKINENNVRSGLHFKTDSALTPNKKGTQLFYKTGALFNSVIKEKVNNEEYKVIIAQVRAEIASRLQTGNIRGGIKRPFFGLNNQVEIEIRNLLKTKSFAELFITK